MIAKSDFELYCSILKNLPTLAKEIEATRSGLHALDGMPRSPRIKGKAEAMYTRGTGIPAAPTEALAIRRIEMKENLARLVAEYEGHRRTVERIGARIVATRHDVGEKPIRLAYEQYYCGRTQREIAERHYTTRQTVARLIALAIVD